MARATSVSAKLAMDESGQTDIQKVMAIAFVKSWAGCSRLDIAEAMKAEFKHYSTVSARVTELLKCGDLFEEGYKKNLSTNKTVHRLYAV